MIDTTLKAAWRTAVGSAYSPSKASTKVTRAMAPARPPRKNRHSEERQIAPGPSRVSARHHRVKAVAPATIETIRMISTATESNAAMEAL
jgi:hypothetical protein